MEQQTKRFKDRFFYAVGLKIGTYPISIIIGFLSFAAFCSLGLLQFEEIEDVEAQFTPLDSPSWDENNHFYSFISHDGEPYTTRLFVRAIDSETLLRERQAMAVVETINVLENRLKVIDEDGHSYSYRDLCNSICNSNQLLSFIFSTLSVDTLTLNVSKWNVANTRDPNLRLTYPIMKIFDRTVYVGDKLYGVNTSLAKSQYDRGGAIESVKVIVINFQSIFHNDSHKDLMKKWDAMLWREVRRINKESTAIRIAFINAEIIASEVRRTSLSSLPYLVACMLLFCIVSLLTTLHPNENYPAAVLTGIVLPVIGVLTSFGMLVGVFRIAYQPIVTVSIFLVVAVGVDDLFLILSAWRDRSSEMRIPERMAQTLVEAGPSITLTTVTNVLSFGIGTFTTTPAVKAFSLFTSVAMTVTFIFQVFLFSAALCLLAQRTKTPGPEIVKKIRTIYTKTVSILSKILASYSAIPLFAAIATAYAVVVYVGLRAVHVEMRADKIFLADSPIFDYLRMERSLLRNEADKVFVIVTKPGNLLETSVLKEAFSMLSDYETVDRTHFGAHSTNVFLRPYMQYLSFFSVNSTDDRVVPSSGDVRPFTYKLLPRFVEEHPEWKMLLHINEDACYADTPQCIHSYMFTTAFKSLSNITQSADLLFKWRSIASKYSERGVFVYNPRNYLCDQLKTVGGIAIKTVTGTLLCMAVICIVFIGETSCVISAVITVLSINAGVLSLMALSGITLDAIALAGLLMAVGFSVDYTAHISYHFRKFNEQDLALRIKKTILAVGWPSGQAALTTNLAAGILMFAKSQLVVSFAKAVLIVIMLALVHALIILPIILIMSTRMVSLIRRLLKQRKSDDTGISVDEAMHRKQKRLCGL